MHSFQNAGRKPIIEDTTRSWTIAENPFGDDPQVCGFMVVCHDPVADGPELIGDLYPTHAQAVAFRDAILAD